MPFDTKYTKIKIAMLCIKEPKVYSHRRAFDSIKLRHCTCSRDNRIDSDAYVSNVNDLCVHLEVNARRVCIEILTITYVYLSIRVHSAINSLAFKRFIFY